MLANEYLAEDIQLYLQELGKFITANKLTEYLTCPEIKLQHGITKNISKPTACCYLAALGYRFTCPKKGQFSDGHERADIVFYRENVYLPKLATALETSWIYKNDGSITLPTIPPNQRRTVIWYHDESIFYAHDRRHKTWYHKDASAVPYKKGDGASFMIADYVLADFGWLRGINGETARKTMWPGANKDGYFTVEDIKAQAMQAITIAQTRWPEIDHILVYDNATTHRKREDGCLSARHMPKKPSGSTNRKTKSGEDPNFMVEVNKRDADGKLLYNPHGNLQKEKIRMTGALFSDGTPQPLYFPADHPQYPNKFKGMKEIIEERGLHQFATLPAECKQFKCADTQANCCCR